MSEPPITTGAPLFLVGAERSGSTLLRLLLDHHRQIAWLNEFEYAIDQVTDEGRFPGTAEYSQWLATHRIFQASGLSVGAARSYPDLIRSFLEQHRQRSGKRLVGATVHRHFDRVLHIWPDARFIHIVRDPRDVARSCIGMGWAGNAFMGVSRWIEVERLWERLQPSISRDRWIEVHFERLVDDPQSALRDVCTFIGVDFDPQMLVIEGDTTYEQPDRKLAS